jgi:transposase-like protein
MFNLGNHSTSAQLDLKVKRKSYDGPFKARIVSEWINRKRRLNESAEFHDVHPSQIKSWKSILLKRASHVLEDKRRSKAALPVMTVLKDILSSPRNLV